MTPYSVTVSATDDGLVSVAGELDANAGPVVRPAVTSMLSSCAGPRTDSGRLSSPAVLDLTEVTFAASAGLSLLLELDARASAKKVPLTLIVTPDSPLARILDRTGLAMVLTVSSPVGGATTLDPGRFGWFDDHR